MSDGVKFDLLATGQPVQTGWVAPSDGLLVRDLNADGTINDGRELFGNATVLADGSTATDGYQALAELDSNHDGVISSADAAYSQLGVWVDANSDGISETGEVQSLAALGITEISVTAQVTTTQDHGNTIGLTSSYQTADGVSHLAGDVWFAAQDAASYSALSALSTATVAAFRTDQLSALSTVQVQALTTGDLVALQIQSVSALGDASAMAPLSDASVRSASANAPQVAVASDQPSNESPQDLAVALASGLAQRASALAQAIGTFDSTGGPRTVATQTLNVPVDSYAATKRSATLAVGNLVDQICSFDSQAMSAASGQACISSSPLPALAATQIAPMAMLDSLKRPVTDNIAGLTGGDFKTF